MIFPVIMNGENPSTSGAIGALLVNADTRGAITDMAMPLHKPAAAVATSNTAFTTGPTTKLLYGISLPNI